jgi:hypothetical protein
MKITKKQLKRIIREEMGRITSSSRKARISEDMETLSYDQKVISAEEAESAALARDRAEDLETVKDAWDGGANLVHPVDFETEALDGEKAVHAQQVLKVTENKLRQIIRSRVLSEQGGWGEGIETGSPLIDFARAWSGLGNAVQEQVEAVIAAYNLGGGPNSREFEDVVYEQNPNAIDMAQQRLMHVARDVGGEGEDIIDALNEAQNILSR